MKYSTSGLSVLLLVLTLFAQTLPALAREKAPLSLVDIEELDAGFVFDVHYATDRNFTGHQLYPFPKVYLHRDAARALVAVQEDLQTRGYGLKIFDGFRPINIQQKMWDLIQDERYVSNPAVNRGRHTRGASVDVALVDAKGRDLEMPTQFDDFSVRAHADTTEDISEAAIRNRQILTEAMKRHGFLIYPYEWWHFDLEGWENYPVIEFTYEEVEEQLREDAVPAVSMNRP